MQFSITIAETAGVARRGDPVEVGLPLPAGGAVAGTTWTVLDEAGAALPSQFRPLLHHPDGSPRALHGVFLIDLEPGQSRTLTVAPGPATRGPVLLAEQAGALRVDTGPLTAEFNASGELTSLRLDGVEALDTSGGPSLVLSVALGPARVAYHGLTRMETGTAVQATVREAGPVRAILHLQGKLVLKDRRGPVELLLDADYVFYAGRAELHVRPLLLGAVTDATVIDDWSLHLHLRNGRRLAYGRAIPLVREDPNHEKMLWSGVPEGWAQWALADGHALTFWSGDFARQQNGFLNSMVVDAAREHLHVAVSRIEPLWWYQDVSHVPTSITINRGGWRRWEAVFALQGEAAAPQDEARRWAAPLRAFTSPEHFRRGLSPRLEGVAQPTPLRERVAEKCAEFVCRERDYAGSLHGGWDGVNQVYLERGVSRGDFGDYLFQEFFRSADPQFYRMGSDFGRIYRDVFCFTIPEASDGGHELGGARSRASEHSVCPIRSYRGAVLLSYMYQETGDERYLEALRLRAAYHLANYPHLFGRVSMGVHDSTFLADYLDQPALVEKALEVTRHSLDKHFDPVAGYFEEYDQSRTLPDGRHPAYAHAVGVWYKRDYLPTSNASPEMAAYNIIGWYGLCRYLDPGEEIRGKIRRVCAWFRDLQNPDGSWPYPHYNSATRWGHGCLQDALAMVLAYKLFGDESFLDSAARSLAFAERMFSEHGRIPLLLGLLPHEETEDSLTYYYGIETLALYAECRGTAT